MEIREKFLNYFKNKGHLVLPSANLIPEDDPSVLLTTAGMQPFKPYYLGVKKPPSARIATVQKCFRTSDIESVGYTQRHLTFFEMLGNFSFGDYFKKEAIEFSLDFVLNELGLDIENLRVAVFRGEGKLPRDEEAINYWKKSGIPENRIYEFGKSENFWGPAGETGPCGPCTEIYYDFGPGHGCGSDDCNPECECGRFLEIWNLVFTQYNFNGTDYIELPSKNIDTGMGLERTAAVLEGTPSVFKTFLFKEIVDTIKQLAPRDSSPVGQDQYIRAVRIIADHSRAIYFLISDGVIPSNEGRGYILRRIIRRATRFGRLLGIGHPFLNDLGKKVINNYSKAYPQLRDGADFAFKIVDDEEKRFSKTLKEGSRVLSSSISKLKQKNQIDMDPRDAFRLYETFGFPIELTQEILKEKGLKLKLDKFNEYMQEHAEKSKEKDAFDKKIDKKIDLYRDLAKKYQIDFVGYQTLKSSTEVARILAYRKADQILPADTLTQNQKGEIVLKSTPFYAEKGGQSGDQGKIILNDSLFEVEDTQMPVEGIYVHKGKMVSGQIKIGDKVQAVVDFSSRRDISKNHTATHLLHWALKAVLGKEVNQSGSLVHSERMRFDYVSYQAPQKSELERVEHIVNQKIQNDDVVRIFETTKTYAQEIGAIALFDEKYGDFVRVIEINNYSRELCGGTHVRRTGEIGLFKIISETSIGANTRRIEAVTGMHAFNYLNVKAKLFEKVSSALGAEGSGSLEAIKELKEANEELSGQLKNIRIKAARDELVSKFNYDKNSGYLKLFYHDFSNSESGKGLNADSLAMLGDQVRDMYGQSMSFIVLGNVVKNKPVLILQATPDLVKKGIHCGKLAKEAGKILGGGGGGKPDFAQSGGSNPELVSRALESVINKVEELCA
ncbi:MAG: alanine--tRNA ligase [Actinomycetota bacterium]